MNTFAQEVTGRATTARPGFQEYPKQLNKPGAASIVVNDEAEEESAAARGYSDKPLAIAPRVQVAVPMTTPAATQAAYDSLKKEFEETATAFNVKFRDLEFEHARLIKAHETLRSAHSTLVDSNNGLKGRYRNLKDEFDKARGATPVTAVAAPDEDEEDDSEFLEQMKSALRATPPPDNK